MHGQAQIHGRFHWWRDVRFWGSYPLAILMVPAGIYGIWYEIAVAGEYICFHSVWGSAFLLGALAMLFFNTRRLRRFNALMRDESTSHFLEHRKEMEELIQDLPNKQRAMYKERLNSVSRRTR